MSEKTCDGLFSLIGVLTLALTIIKAYDEYPIKITATPKSIVLKTTFWFLYV